MPRPTSKDEMNPNCAPPSMNSVRSSNDWCLFVWYIQYLSRFLESRSGMCRVHEISDRFRANLFQGNPSIHCEVKCNCKPTALGTCPRYYAHICGRSSSILALDMPRMIINLKLLNSVVHGPHPGRKSKVRTPSNPRYTRPIKSPNGQGTSWTHVPHGALWYLFPSSWHPNQEHESNETRALPSLPITFINFKLTVPRIILAVQDFHSVSTVSQRRKDRRVRQSAHKGKENIKHQQEGRLMQNTNPTKKISHHWNLPFRPRSSRLPAASPDQPPANATLLPRRSRPINKRNDLPKARPSPPPESQLPGAKFARLLMYYYRRIIRNSLLPCPSKSWQTHTNAFPSPWKT
jgi:hypothetical protein